MNQDEIIEPQLKNATPKAKLLRDLMNANIPKNETEWAAKEHIEYLIETIELLKAKLSEFDNLGSPHAIDLYGDKLDKAIDAAIKKDK